MKSTNFLFVLTLTLLLVAGCATVGRKLDQSKVEQIKTGSTQEDVTRLVGSPDRILRDAAGGSQWSYMFTIATPKPENFVPVVNLFASGANVRQQSLDLFFNASGVVTNLIQSTSATGVGVGASSGSAPSKESMRPVTAGKRVK